MSDKGWVLNRGRDRWELLAADGEPTGYGVSRRYLAVYGAAGMNRELGARGLPPLDPAGPWWHLIMVGGPLDGLHDWADPAAGGGPPARLTVAWAARVILVDPPDAVATLTRATYRRAGAGCGHGRGCPVAYVQAEDPEPG